MRLENRREARWRAVLLFVLSLLIVPGIARAQSERFSAGEPRLLHGPGKILSVSLPITNDGTNAISNLQATTVTLGKATRLTPGSLPATLGNRGGLNAGATARVDAGFDSRKLTSGDKHRLTVEGTYRVGSTTYGFTVSDYVIVPPVNPAPSLWPADREEEFQERARAAILRFRGQSGANTWGENEKNSYPVAMFDFLAGNQTNALGALQAADAQAGDFAHVLGIDYYHSFTLKGQMRKYFFFGDHLDPAYKRRLFDAATLWAEQDPLTRPHPVYGFGRPNPVFGVADWGRWVEPRNTDNLRAMRDIGVYLMAEESGNEATRLLYKGKIIEYVRALYHTGMGEWDSENYHGHALTSYVNLYDFAKDPEAKLLGKAALDWFCAAGAVKYHRGGFTGPSKRDFGGANKVFGGLAVKNLALYFGDTPFPNPAPDREELYQITSSYRPPLAIVALARKQFDRPVELINIKPPYANYNPGQPRFWETLFFGNTYQLGSAVSREAEGDVAPFRLTADNTQRGVDYFVAHSHGNITPSKNAGDQIGQYRNLLIWLRPTAGATFFFQTPKTAEAEIDDDIWFFRYENTWLAVRPINLNHYETGALTDARYPDEDFLRATPGSAAYSGFALEVGEPQTHGSYEDFKQAVKSKGSLDLDALGSGTVQMNGSTGSALRLTHQRGNDLPVVVRDGAPYDWLQSLDLYRPAGGAGPISLGWRQGTLRVEAGGKLFEQTVTPDGQVTFREE